MQQKIKKVFHFTGSSFFRRITALVFSHFSRPFLTVFSLSETQYKASKWTSFVYS